MIKSFHPPLRTLMGPGPSDVSPRVLAAMARPTIGHLDPAFIGMMDEIKQLLQYALRTENALTMPVSAPGSAGMEACFVNLVEPGDKVIVCQNGVFGGRMKENVERFGGVALMVEDDWGTAVSLGKVKALMEQHDAGFRACRNLNGCSLGCGSSLPYGAGLWLFDDCRCSHFTGRDRAQGG